MMYSRFVWGLWALVPVAALTYHFGPGQNAYVLDRAARMQNQASDTQTQAQVAQDAAYAQHLEAIEARRKAFIDPSENNQQVSRDANMMEENAYANAAQAWKNTADQFEDVLATLGEAAPSESQNIRLAKARASVRAGEIWTGIDDFESLVSELDDAPEHDKVLARAAREELATAYYYGARLLRLSGMPPQEWRVESGNARQQFRYLAEREVENAAGNSDATAAATNYQRNLELVLNLEQSSLVELQGKPLPKDSPRIGKCENRSFCKGKKPKSKPGPKKDGRSGSLPGDIGPGW